MPHVLSAHESFKASENVSIDRVHKFSWWISVHLKASLWSFSFENTSSIQCQRVNSFHFVPFCTPKSNLSEPRTCLAVRSTDPGIILVKLSFCQVSAIRLQVSHRWTGACEYVDWIVPNCAFLSRQSGTWCERPVRLSPSFALGSFPNQKMQMTVMLRTPWYKGCKGCKGYKGSPPKPPKPYVLSLAPMAPMPKSALVLSHRDLALKFMKLLMQSWPTKFRWLQIRIELNFSDLMPKEVNKPVQDVHRF